MADLIPSETAEGPDGAELVEGEVAMAEVEEEEVAGQPPAVSVELKVSQAPCV